MTAKTSERIYSVSICVICAVIALLCLYPLLYTLLVSFCAPSDINASYFLPIPEKFTVQAYAQVLTAGNYIVRAIGVSVFRTVVGTVLSLAFSSLLAYALSRQELPGRNAVIKLVLFCILFNGGLIPTYVVIDSIGLTDNIWVYIFPNVINVWNVIIIKQFFEGGGEYRRGKRMDDIHFGHSSHVQARDGGDRPVYAGGAVEQLV